MGVERLGEAFNGGVARLNRHDEQLLCTWLSNSGGSIWLPGSVHHTLGRHDRILLRHVRRHGSHRQACHAALHAKSRFFHIAIAAPPIEVPWPTCLPGGRVDSVCEVDLKWRRPLLNCTARLPAAVFGAMRILIAIAFAVGSVVLVGCCRPWHTASVADPPPPPPPPPTYGPAPRSYPYGPNAYGRVPPPPSGYEQR
jgi:hypothetical protein